MSLQDQQILAPQCFGFRGFGQHKGYGELEKARYSIKSKKKVRDFLLQKFAKFQKNISPSLLSSSLETLVIYT